MPSALSGLLELNTYNATLVAAAAVGVLALWLTARAYDLDAGFALDAALAGLLLGIVAGRAEVVVANLSYFRERPLSILVDLRSGGVGQRSLTATGLVAYLSIVAARRLPWRNYAAAITPAAALASAVAWAGLAFSGLGAGAEVDSPILASLPDLYGVVAPRLPVQFAMAGGHLFLAAAVLVLYNHLMRPGLGLCLWAATSAALSALLDGFKAEPVYLANGVPRALVADAALAIAWLVVAAIILIFCRSTAITEEPGATEPPPSPAAPSTPPTESTRSTESVEPPVPS